MSPTCFGRFQGNVLITKTQLQLVVSQSLHNIKIVQFCLKLLQ